MRYSLACSIAVICALGACHSTPPLTPTAAPPPSTTAQASLCPAVPAAPPAPAAAPPCPASKPAEKSAPAAPSTAPDPAADRLAELYEKQPKSADMGPCNLEPPRTKVSEISIERTRCFGECEAYSLTLHADGSVEFYGEDNTKPYNAHHGTIAVEYFDQLARLAEDIGWFGLGTNYACHVTDSPTTYTSIVRNKVRKTIRHYAPAMSGPPRLYFFERMLDDYRRHIEWAD